MKRHPPVGVILVLSALVALIIVEVGTSGPGSATRRPAPALPAQVLSGGQITLASLEGKPAFINFWASWCTPCKQEAPELERFAQSLNGRATLVGVDWGDALDGANQFIADNHLTYPILRDTTSKVGTAYGLRGLPTTFVLDARGRIVESLRGPQTFDTLNGVLTSLLPGT